jgi:DNA-binding MarR family transcriptional regulator
MTTLPLPFRAWAWAAARLEKRQWITRSSDPHDARRTLARLTETGAQLLDRVEPGYAEQVRRHVFDRLDARQTESLEDLAEAVLTSLHPDCLEIMPVRTPQEHA